MQNDIVNQAKYRGSRKADSVGLFVGAGGRLTVRGKLCGDQRRERKQTQQGAMDHLESLLASAVEEAKITVLANMVLMGNTDNDFMWLGKS